jgi:hypothetical protein
MIINAFTHTENLPGHCGCGFGEYIRGSLALYQAAKELNLQFRMDLSNHTIGQYLVGHDVRTTNNKPDELFRNFHLYWKPKLKKYINHKFWKLSQNPNIRQKVYVILSNCFPDYPLSEDCKEYVRSQMMPNEQLEKIIAQHKPNEDYVCVHIRTGDWVGFSENDNAIEELAEKISDNMAEIKAQANGRKIFVFSDSIALKQLLKKQHNIHYTETVPSHSMHADCNSQDMLVDWFMLQYSQHIYQFTNDYHNWGSGFSDSASWLRDVPITKFKF